MGKARELEVRIIGDGKSAKRTFQYVGDEAKKMEGRVKETDTAAGRLSQTLSKIVDPLRRVRREKEGALSDTEVVVFNSRITELRKNVRDLTEDFAVSGDMDIFKKLNKSKRELKIFESAKKDLDGFAVSAVSKFAKVGEAFGKIGVSAGSLISESLGNSIKSMPMPIQMAISGAIIAGVASVAPLAAGLIGGAIAAGIGSVGIAAGIVGAFSDPAVKAAAVDTGNFLKTILNSSAQFFAPKLIEGFRQIRAAMTGLQPLFMSIFSQGAQYIQPLVQGVIGFVQQFSTALDNGIGKLGPIFQELASWGPRLGETVGVVFEMFANNADGIAVALHDAFNVVQIIVVGLAGLVNMMITVYNWTAKVADKLGPMGALLNPLHALAGLIPGVSTDMNQMGASASGSAADITKLKTSATEANTSVGLLQTTLGKFASGNISVSQATIAMNNATRDAKKAFSEQHGKVKEGTQAYDDLRGKLNTLAESANTTAERITSTGGSVREAGAATAGTRSNFIALAKQLTGSSTAAKRLADDLLVIPSPEPKVTLNSGAAESQIAAIEAQLNAIPDQTVNVNIRQNRAGSNVVSGSASAGFATGGAVNGPGTGTSDSIAAWLSNGEYVIPADVVSKLGVGYFDSLRSGKMPAFAKGGRVSKYIRRGSKGRADGNFTKTIRQGGKKLYTGKVDDLNAIRATILDNTTGKLNSSMRKQLDALRGIANKREAVAKKLDDAKQKLADAIAKRDDYRNQIKMAAISAGDITKGNDEVTNSSLLLSNLQQQLDKTKQFRDMLQKLKSMGINQTSYQQIVDAGVDGGFASAQALLNGGTGAIGQLNSLQTQLNTAADGLGYDASQRLYQAGVNSAQGVVKGLESQAKALEKASKKLADQIVKTLKKALGIKSPSRVLADQVGRHMATGIAMGVDDNAYHVSDSLINATNPAGLGGAVSGASNGSGGDVHFHITVEGSVLTEKQLGERLAPVVRNAIVKTSNNNGGRTGF